MSIELPPQGTRGGRGFVGRPARISNAFVAWIYRRTGGLTMPKNILLTTIGARSGDKRVATMRRFDDGNGRWLIVGSAAGGSKHPAWAYNIAAHPDEVWIDLGRERFKVQPELLQGADRAAAWKRIAAEASNFGRYERSTDRELPVFRLTREA